MKNWYWIPVFVIVFFVGDRLAGGVLASLTDRSNFRYSRLYTGRAGSDILLVGNSRGLNFYQPSIEAMTGRSTFNVSYNGLPPQLVAVLMHDYRRRYGVPQDVIIDITFLDRDNDALIEDFRVYAAYSEGIDSLLAIARPSIHRGTRLAHLTRYGGEVSQRMLYYLGRSDEDWLLDRVMGPTQAAGITEVPAAEYGYSADNIALIAKTVADYRSLGSRVHLVVNPYFPPYAEKLTNLDALIDAVEAATKLQVRDYSKSIAEPALFGDYQHLNKAGAKVYLKKLLRDLSLVKE